MSVEQTDVVDFISIDKHGTAVLTISDHLGWDSADDHVVKLQKELNRYLVFIESGASEGNDRGCRLRSYIRTFR